MHAQLHFILPPSPPLIHIYSPHLVPPLALINPDWKERYGATQSQDNSYDCGVFVVGFIQAIVRGGLEAAKDFGASKCIALRRDILETLMHPK